MNTQYITDLITEIKSNTNLATIFWTNVFYYLPNWEVQATYLNISLLADNKQVWTTKALLEFRIIAANTEIAPLVMHWYMDTLMTEITSFNDFNANSEFYSIEFTNDVFLWNNNKNRLEIIKSCEVSYGKSF